MKNEKSFLPLFNHCNYCGTNHADNQLLNNIINRESEFLRPQILSDSAAVTSSESLVFLKKFAV